MSLPLAQHTLSWAKSQVNVDWVDVGVVERYSKKPPFASVRGSPASVDRGHTSALLSTAFTHESERHTCTDAHIHTSCG